MRRLALLLSVSLQKKGNLYKTKLSFTPRVGSLRPGRTEATVPPNHGVDVGATREQQLVITDVENIIGHVERLGDATEAAEGCTDVAVSVAIGGGAEPVADVAREAGVNADKGGWAGGLGEGPGEEMEGRDVEFREELLGG